MTNNKQQTVVDRIVNLLNKEGFAPVLTEEEIKSFKEMEKIQKFHMFNCGRQYQLTGEGTFKQVYQEMYGEDDSLKINNGGHQI
jgi:hypothetical protein